MADPRGAARAPLPIHQDFLNFMQILENVAKSYFCALLEGWRSLLRGIPRSAPSNINITSLDFYLFDPFDRDLVVT